MLNPFVEGLFESTLAICIVGIVILELIKYKADDWIDRWKKRKEEKK